MKRLLMSVCMLLMVTVTVAPAWADTEIRPATPFEQDYVLRVLTGFDRAASQGPAGWTETDRTEVAAPEHMPVGVAWGPLQVRYSVAWENREAKAVEAERREAAARSIEPPDETVMEEINREMDKLSREMASAAQNGDMQTVQRLQKEVEKLAARSQAAFASTNAQIRQIQEDARKDMDVKVRYAANTFDKRLTGAHRLSPVSGLPVYRVENEDAEAKVPGTSYVFIGDWDIREEGGSIAFHVEPRADRMPASVQTVLVAVDGEDSLTRNMLESIDWNALRSLIAK